jgi:hypothetical protein
MAIKWLMENAGAVVRYRVQTELMDINEKAQLQNYVDAVLALEQTQKRMNFLKNLDYNRVHGSDCTFLENILPILSDFGLHYGIDAFRNTIRDNLDVKKIVKEYSNYNKIISYPFLLRSKIPIYGLLNFAMGRINTIYDFTQHMDFNLYDETANHKGVPKPFLDRPIIKPKIAHGDMCRLPLIYDIVTMAEVYHRVPSETQAKIDNIISYILSPGYDAVVPGYGILSAPARKYYSMGWDCKKPFNDSQDYSYPNIHRLLLYSCFPAAVKNMWFLNAINYLMQYKTANGTFIFPKEYLNESDSNWVLGSHMSLAENRRKKQYAEIESTFYMLKLIKNSK